MRTKKKAAKKPYKFLPDYAVAPGEILKEILVKASKYVPNKETRVLLQRIIDGHMRIDEAVAGRLEGALGRPAQFWLNLQANYDKYYDRY